MNSVDYLFKNKNEVKFYVPTKISNDKTDGFVVELLDSIDAYITPLLNGLSKGDVYDYITSPLFANTDILTYLKLKKYVTDEAEFSNIFTKYTEMEVEANYIECYEVNIKLDTVSANKINETELSNVIVSLVNGQIPTNVPSNYSIKKAYYVMKMGRFTYIAQV